MGHPSDGDAILDAKQADDVVLLGERQQSKRLVANLLGLENDIPIGQREPLFPHVKNPFNNRLFNVVEVSSSAFVKRLLVFFGVAQFFDVPAPMAKLIGLDCKIPANRAKRLSCSQSLVGSGYHPQLVSDRKSSWGHDGRGMQVEKVKEGKNLSWITNVGGNPSAIGILNLKTYSIYTLYL